MKAALCKHFGPPEVVVVEDIPEPEAGPGEVVVKVTAAALNFFDTLAIRDKYQFKPDLPFSPGAEVAGVIETLGEGVTGFEPGMRVAASARFNGCREKTAVSADSLVAIPAAVSDEVASGVRITYGTAIHGLRDRGRVRKGQSVAVLGASGGAGLAAVEVAKRMGARVIACASSPEKLELAREHGADEGINYSTEGLKSRLKELTDGNGVDVVYDCVGGDYTEAAFRAIAWGGRYLVVGFASGVIPKMPLNLPLLKGADIAGVFWGAFTERDPATNRANIEQTLEWCARGELKPHIHGVYPLEKIVEALEIIDNREATGKVIIAP